MKVTHLLILILCGMLLPKALWAQTDCSQSYLQAQRAYDAGRLGEVERLLKSCIRTFTPEERVKAYRLITLANIFLDKLDEADESYSKLLNADPDYEPVDSDPKELQYLHQSFKTSPTATFGIAAGPNLTTPNISTYHSVDNTTVPQGVYSDQVAFQLGLVSEFYFGKDYSISPQLFFTTNKLKFEANLFDFSMLTYTENQTWLEVPIVIKRYFNLKKAGLKPFVSLGAAARFLQKSDASAVRDVTDGRDATGPNINTLSLRNTQNYSAIASVGVKKHFRHVHAFLTLSYRQDLLSQVDRNKRYAIPELIYKYGYVDNDYNTAYLTATVGISYALYKPKRKVPRIQPNQSKTKDSVARKKRNR